MRRWRRHVRERLAAASASGCSVLWGGSLHPAQPAASHTVPVSPSRTLCPSERERQRQRDTDLEGGQCARESGTVSGASMASARRGRGCLALCVSAAVVVLVLLAAVADGMCALIFIQFFHPRPLLLHSVTDARNLPRREQRRKMRSSRARIIIRFCVCVEHRLIVPAFLRRTCVDAMLHE